MIKFKADSTDPTRPGVVGLGLTERNLELLREGKPILIQGKDMQIDHNILLVFGKDENALLEQLKPFTAKDVKVHGEYTDD